MFKMIFKSALILSLPVLACAASAYTVSSKEALANQCRDLSKSVASIASSQQRTSCVEKLGLASVHIDAAGRYILENRIPSAKQELDDAIFTLQYSELNSCNRYIQISHSRLETQKIKNSL